MDKLGFIGCGNMATGMIKGILHSNKFNKEDIIASDERESQREKVSLELGIKLTKDNKEVAAKSDIIFICVEPNEVGLVAKDIKEALDENKIIVSIAAGVTKEKLKSYFGQSLKVIRCMPNMNIQVGQGMCMLCKDENISKENMGKIKEIFSTFGEVEVLDESFMNAFISISGSSPAYIFMLIEAMADGGVRLGFSREKALKIVTQAVLGSALTVKETNIHPEVLKDRVCSPKGTTIEAVNKLEEEGFRNAIIKGILACNERAQELSK